MSETTQATRSLLRSSLGSATLYLGAKIAAKLIGFAYFLLVARAVDVGMFGILTYAATVAVLADTIADLGMGRIMLREVARAPDSAARLIRLLVPAKLAASLSLYAVMAVVLAGRFNVAQARFPVPQRCFQAAGRHAMPAQCLPPVGGIGCSAQRLGQ